MARSCTKSTIETAPITPSNRSVYHVAILHRSEERTASVLQRVADASHSRDQLVVEAVVDLPAQIADVHVDEIGVTEEIAAPHTVEELVAGVHFVAME